MANKQTLLKEAIADAKAVRETALAQAKLALQEAFTPKIQSMLSAKLQQEMDDEDMMGEEDEEDFGAEMDTDVDAEMEDEPAVESEMGDDEMEEVYGDAHGSDEGGEEDVPAEPMHYEEEEMGDDEDLELEAIIRELEDEMGENEPTDEVGEEEEELEEEYMDSTGIGSGDNKMKQVSSSKVTNDKDLYEDIDINEIIAALREDDSFMGDGTPDGDADAESKEEEEMHEVAQLQAELEEAYKAIATMKASLNETNLLNAKLLFSNKLFKAYDLNEAQKLKVIDNFDRATTLREVKLVYATLAESMKAPAKKRVNESRASKAVASTAPKKQIINEQASFTNRMKKLAGISR